ncbi:MAG: VWA domain-containing protein [Acidobacteria bacterium]|nr:VWA domain-containing protein [Acidobacteriota bacterium]
MKTKNDDQNGFRRRTVHNLMILDESGSMQSIKSATIQGFNEVVQTVRGVEKQFPEQEHFISLVTFNGLGIKTKLFAKKVKTLEELDESSYHPDSLTPLYDAIGFSVNKLRAALDGAENCSVLVTILTDGEENASREFSGAEIKALVKELKKRGWTFTYIGANHDVEKIALSLSITNTLKFQATEQDVKRAFDDDRDARIAYCKSIRGGGPFQRDYFKKPEPRDPQ